MGYADRVMRDIEEKRSAAAAAVGAYLVSLRDGKKLLDPKASAREKIDIEYMYSLIERGVDVAYMVFRVSDEARLLAVLSENAIETVTPQKLGLK